MPTANDTTDLNLVMRALHALTVCAALLSLLATIGCRTTRDNQIDILERELRAQEDYIYELEDYVVEYSDKLRQCRCSQPHVASASKPSPVSKQPTRSSTKKSTVEKKPSLRTLQEPREESILDSAEPATESETPIEELEVPALELEIGEPISSEVELEATHLANSESVEYEQRAETVRIPDPAAYQTATYDESETGLDELGESVEFPFEEETVEEVEEIVESKTEIENVPSKPSSRKAERLVIAHVFRDSTGAPEPSSLLSVVEARDSRNEPADFDGKVSLMVMQGDPESPERIKRWDFTEEETAAAWQTSHFGDGLHLELPLEVAQLPAGPCELWVRLEASDGRKLLAQVPLESATLARMEDADVAQLAHDSEESLEEEVELASINPLRSDRKVKSSSTVQSTSLASADSASKAEPQWRAATHFSAGVNSGFATTTDDQQWKTSAIRNRNSPNSRPSSTTAGKQQWTARK
ncbi:hypothetical protein [Bythopirellula polymerisocia]|uniref:Uncharacterized protein n=1 Tax=Bythopirellula polymerisocia TaxID=2528003 RepID=A0A5C6CL57_9BACT|nr:hypothetical protein [Bythopirellula polymerisocia]TWU25613.1 hypothetical protein Pla144_28200 [Bythopirellula polymerisocia]